MVVDSWTGARWVAGQFPGVDEGVTARTVGACCRTLRPKMHDVLIAQARDPTPATPIPAPQ
jgi:hypothetical protein